MVAGQRTGGNQSDMTSIEVDYAIIGAGPTGLYGAYYAGFRGWSTAVLSLGELVSLLARLLALSL